MITKYTVTDWSGKEVYFESFDEMEAARACYERNKAMTAYLNEEDITYSDIQEMTDKERLKMYYQITGEKLAEVNDDFWDWAEEEVDSL